MLREDPFGEVRDAGVAVPALPDEPRVVVAMAHTSDYMPLAALTVPTVKRYCEKHGYGFYYHPAWEQVVPNDGDRCKIRIYKELYEEKKFDVFVWIDSDAIITNSDVSINALLQKFLDRGWLTEDDHFVWGYDISGPNTGVYIARFTWQAHCFLQASFARGVEMGWGDNTAMIQVSLNPPHNKIVKAVPGRYMNAYLYDIYGWGEYKDVGDWEAARDAGEDFILHLPGLETFPNLDHPERPNRLALVERYLGKCK